MMIDGIHVKSFSAGRVRLKIPELKDSPDLADAVRERIAAVSGIKKVDVNELTGGVLVIYDERRLAAAESQQALQQALAELFPDRDLNQFHSLLQSLS